MCFAAHPSAKASQVGTVWFGSRRCWKDSKPIERRWVQASLNGRVRDGAMNYCQRKKDQHRFDGQGSYDLIEGKETIV